MLSITTTTTTSVLILSEMLSLSCGLFEVGHILWLSIPPRWKMTIIQESSSNAGPLSPCE